MIFNFQSSTNSELVGIKEPRARSCLFFGLMGAIVDSRELVKNVGAFYLFVSRYYGPKNATSLSRADLS